MSELYVSFAKYCLFYRSLLQIGLFCKRDVCESCDAASQMRWVSHVMQWIEEMQWIHCIKWLTHLIWLAASQWIEFRRCSHVILSILQFNSLRHLLNSIHWDAVMWCSEFTASHDSLISGVNISSIHCITWLRRYSSPLNNVSDCHMIVPLNTIWQLDRLSDDCQSSLDTSRDVSDCQIIWQLDTTIRQSSLEAQT